MRVVVRLTGGTGNQLFGYAIGRELETRGHFVQYNIEDLKIETNRMYMLDKLGLKLDLTPDKPRVIVQETSMRFNESFLDPKQDQYLIGYFQSEKYFLNAAEKIKSEFQWLRLGFGPISWKTMCLVGDMHRGLTASIHVRRTDYLKNEWLHGGVGIPYYQTAIDHVMMDCCSIAHFYVFSDDPEYCKQHFTWDNMTVVDSKWSGKTVEGNEIERAPGGQEHEDLLLMSLCDYAIIANSTFSWWGAWLGRDKKVYAPKNWFKSNTVDATDIVPERWNRL